MISSLLFVHCTCFYPNDPLFNEQYHIKNTGQFNGLEGEDANVVPAWEKNLTGLGVRVLVYTGGCNHMHNELKDRYDLDMSWNFYSNSSDPTPSNMSLVPDIGTQTLGIIGAASNAECGVGIAPKAVLGCINVFDSTKQVPYDKVFTMFPSARIRLLFSTTTCSSVQNPTSPICYATPFSPSTDALFSDINTIFVAPATGMPYVNDDINFHSFASSSNVFSFGELSQRGYATSTSVPGGNLLASVVVGGGTGNSATGPLFPHLVSCSAESHDKCLKGVSPNGMGAPIAAGVIALMIEANPLLTQNDVSAIIALTSIKNDPKSFSWKRNFAGYMFSRMYGFGRIDAERATSVAKAWPQQPNISNQNGYNKTIVKIPTFVDKYAEVEINISENQIEFITMTNLLVQLDGYDFSNLRIWLISPSGTTRQMKDVGIWAEGALSLYSLKTREFFGENSAGLWKVRFQRSGVGPKLETKIVQIIVTGYINQPQLPIIGEKNGTDPFTQYTINKDVIISNHSSVVVCGNPYTLNLSIPSSMKKYPFDIVVKPRGKSEFTLVGKSDNGLFSIPCLYGSQKMDLYLQSPVEGVQSQVYSINYENNYEQRHILSPKPYQVFRYPNDTKSTLDIPVSIVDKRKRQISNLASQFGTYSIFSIEPSSLRLAIQSGPIAGNIINVPNLGISCPKCLLVVEPYLSENMDECSSFIQPISMLKDGEIPPNNWIVDWNSHCPIPPGIITAITPVPTQSPTSENPHELNIGLILSIGIPLFILFSTLVAYFFYNSCRTRGVEPRVHDPLLNSYITDYVNE